MTTPTDEGNKSTLARNFRVAELAPDGANYLSWRMTLQIILMAETDLWEVVTRKLERPVIPVTDPKTEPTPAQKETEKRFEKANKIARGIIIGNLSPEAVISVCEYYDLASVTAAVLWDGAKDYSVTRTGASMEVAYSEFQSFSYDTRKTPDQNINRFDELVQIIREGGEKVPDYMLKTRLIECLPTSWSVFKQSLLAFVGNYFYFDIRKMIITEGHRRTASSKTGEQVTALMASMSFGNRGKRRVNQGGSGFRSSGEHPNQPMSKEFHCWSCGGRGHIQKYCRKLRTSSEANTAEASAAYMVEL